MIIAHPLYPSLMTTYKDAGVDIEKGDRASAIAAQKSYSTFSSRIGRIGEPLSEVGGFGGFLDMGDYYLVQTDDGTGTKIDLACELQKFDTLGYDLLAMVADDIVCTGAEVISVTNTLDVPKLDTDMIEELMDGFAHACREQKIVIPAGEIAEVPGAVHSAVWSATALGIVAKDRVLKPETIVPGDLIISLREYGPRCNGYSLIRKILKGNWPPFVANFACHGEVLRSKAEEPRIQTRENLHLRMTQFSSLQKELLRPSTIYHSAILKLIGRYGEERRVDIKGIAHITGGGIPSKLGRVLKKSGYGADLTHLWDPPESLTEIMHAGNVTLEEAYRTWNMGNGMMLIIDSSSAHTALKKLTEQKMEARIAGVVTPSSSICIRASSGPTLQY